MLAGRIDTHSVTVSALPDRHSSLHESLRKSAAEDTRAQVAVNARDALVIVRLLRAGFTGIQIILAQIEPYLDTQASITSLQ
jgi:hypothetical protein